MDLRFPGFSMLSNDPPTSCFIHASRSIHDIRFDLINFTLHVVFKIINDNWDESLALIVIFNRQDKSPLLYFFTRLYRNTIFTHIFFK